MLRSPTHVPTIQLTQIHQTPSYETGRATGTTSVHRKLYHDHFYQSESQYKQQQKEQENRKDYHLNSKPILTTTTTATATRRRSRLLFSAAIRTTTTTAKIQPSDVNGSDLKTKSKPATTTTATRKLKVSNLNSTTTTTTTSPPPVTSVAALSKATSSNHLNTVNNSTKILTPSGVPATTATTTTKTRSPTATLTSSMSPTSQTPTRTSLFDSCHRKIRLIGGGPVAFLGGLVAKARRKERDGDQSSTDTKLYLEESVLERKLPEADLKALVDLPAGLDYNEWLASHTLALFEHVNLVYGTVSEFCTPSGCPDMTGPGNRTYLWFDEKGKKTRVAAPQYIDYVMTFTQKTVSDESIFPTKYANEFPGSFESIARKILRLQFHVIAHLYAAHFREIALLGLHTHLNLTFAHLTALHRRFNLIDEKETDVLRDLEVALRLTDDSHATGHNNHVLPAPSHSDQSSSSSYEPGSATNYVATAGVYAGSNQQQQHIVTVASASVDDAAASTAPICTQPEAKVGANNVFGGGGGLMGGILGDFTGSDFSDTSRYCTSAVPSSSSSSSFNNATAANAGGTNGAGALQLNFNNNFAQAHHQHHLQHLHHHHHHHHHHQPPQPSPHQQNMGLLQCNTTATAPSPHNTTTA